MQRIDAPEILDSDACSPGDAQAVLEVIGRVNRWFGGIATTQKMVERVARVTGSNHFSLLEVAAGLGEVPEAARENVAQGGITLDVTLLDIAALASAWQKFCRESQRRKSRRSRRRARSSFRRRSVRSGELQSFCASSGPRATGAVRSRRFEGQPPRATNQ